MSEQRWLPIAGLGERGIEADLLPQTRAANSLDTATNLRYVGNDIHAAGGYTDDGTTDAKLADFTTFFPSANSDFRDLVFCRHQDATAAFYKYPTASPDFQDISGNVIVVPTPDQLVSGQRWSGGWLNGGLSLALPYSAVRTWRLGSDPTTIPMVWNGGPEGNGDTWEDLKYHCRVMRPFRDYMIAANLSQWDPDYLGGAYREYPARVAWCHPVEPGQVPEDWVTRPTNQAGDVDLGWSEGDIIDMAVLGDTMFIFSEDRIDAMDWVGIQDQRVSQIFSFREVTRSRGLSSRDCVQQYKGFLYCQGPNDIYRLDGSSAAGGIESLIWGRLKNEWLGELDAARARNNWVAVDPYHEEIIFAYVSNFAPAEYVFPDRALVLHLGDSSRPRWSKRSYGFEMPFARRNLDVANDTSQYRPFYCINRDGEKVQRLEEGYDRVGAVVPARIGRKQLVLGTVGHQAVRVTDAEVIMSGAQATVTLSERSFADGPVVARPALVFDPATQEHLDLIGDAIQFDYRIDISATTFWRLNSIHLLAQITADRRG